MISWKIRSDFIKAVLSGDSERLFETSIMYIEAFIRACNEVEKEKHGRVRKSSKKSSGSKRTKGGKNASI